jgi:GT2 family glycosyltransferase
MMSRELFETVGGFDERFGVCEDYDLWLRIAVDHAVLLLPAALVVKRGGHADQLSRSEWGMDRFRILALAKLLRSGLHGEKRQWAGDELRRKIAVFCAGARKRGKEKEALFYEGFLTQSFEETIDVGRAHSPLCAGEKLPSIYAGALAEVESSR